MFLFVYFAFKWVKLEIRNGIINIPLRYILSMGDLPIRTIEYAGQDSTNAARPGGSQWTCAPREGSHRDLKSQWGYGSLG